MSKNALGIWVLRSKGKDGHSAAAQIVLGESYRYYAAYKHVCICFE